MCGRKSKVIRQGDGFVDQFGIAKTVNAVHLIINYFTVQMID